MSSINHTSVIFRELRPLCVEIAGEPSSFNIDALRDFLQSHKSSNFTALLEYILFPLQATVARKDTSMDLKLRAVRCISVLLSETGINRFDIFQDIFQNVCLMLSSKEPGKVRDISEDAKEVLLDCILVLLNSSFREVLEGMYSTKFMPSVGHCISLLLNIAGNDKAKHLIVRAVKCIQKFVFVSGKDEGELGSEGFQRQEKLLSSKLASFLPGISISLCKIITGGFNQGQNVIIGALEAWMCHIQVVMNDRYLPGLDSSHSVDEVAELMSRLMPQRKEDSVEPKSKQTLTEKGLEVKKDKEWFSNTSSKLKLLLERVSSLAGHPSWKVRLALLRFSEVLLKNCCRSLEKCVPCLVEIVVGFFSDEYKQVSGRSKEIMHELSMLLTNHDQAWLNQIVEENLYTLFSSLPRQIRSTEEQKKLHTLRVIVGYLHLLGGNVKTVLNSGHLLKRISQALVQVLEFDLSDIKIVERKLSQNTGIEPLREKHIGLAPIASPAKQLNSCHSIYKKSFKHFRDDKVLDAVIQICWYLGSYGDVVLLVDHLLDLFRSSTANRKQVAFLMNEIIRGTMRNLDHNNFVHKEFPKERPNYLLTCVTLVLTEYLSRDVWNVRISNDEEERLLSNSRGEDLLVLRDRKPPIAQQSVSFSELNSNIQLLCLMLEGIGIFATLLQEHFDNMLLDVLYPLMEKLGSRNATVSQMAYWSLVTISASCKYGSVEELIGKNVDYLINSISLNLRHISLHPDTPAVLSAMLLHGNKGLIPYLQDTLEEVLSLIDYSSDQFLLSLVKVLNSVAFSVNKWFPGEKSTKKSEEKDKIAKKIIENTDLKEFFIAQLKLKTTSLGDVSDDDLEEEEVEANGADQSEEEEKSNEKNVPQHIKFTERVLEKCTHFLASKFVKVRLVVLDTTEHGVLALGSTENQLLPMIHKLWQPMVKCFSDDELVVRTRAVSVLGTMVNTAGQFMRRRVIKDVFPALTSFLVKQQAVSLKAGPVYNHTQGFKLQLAILNTIGNLCRDLDISDVDCDKVAWSILPYLSQRQPRQLQQAAVDGLRKLIDLEPELIWLSLNDLYCPTAPSPPPPCSTFMFPIVQFVSGSSDKNEYTVNVERLLEVYE